MVLIGGTCYWIRNFALRIYGCPEISFRYESGGQANRFEHFEHVCEIASPSSAKRSKEFWLSIVAAKGLHRFCVYHETI